MPVLACSSLAFGQRRQADLAVACPGAQEEAGLCPGSKLPAQCGVVGSETTLLGPRLGLQVWAEGGNLTLALAPDSCWKTLPWFFNLLWPWDIEYL